MTVHIYAYLLADDGIRQFALQMENDTVKSVAVFAKNSADAKLRPNETVFARSDDYVVSTGATHQETGYVNQKGCSLFSHLYKIKADHAGNPISVEKAKCGYYTFGNVIEQPETKTPFVYFSVTSRFLETLPDKGFDGGYKSIAIVLPENMRHLAGKGPQVYLPFDILKTLPIPQATIARDGVEQSLLPAAIPDPIWIAPDSKALANNYITKKLHGLSL